MDDLGMQASSLGELFSLQGRVVLFTGASGDLGSAMARALGLAGAKLALHGRSEAKLTRCSDELQALGIECAIFPGDVSQLETIPALIEAVLQRFGQIDVLVNCAGINRRLPIEEMTPAIYDEIMNTNLRGLYFLTQAVLPALKQQGGGKIVHIGSLTAAIGLAHTSVYGMTKSALTQLTKTMAVEFAEHNIQVNCICPGFFSTELTAPLWGNPARKKWMLERIPLKRGGSPADLMGLVVYLASPAANYTTGQTIYVDGGFLAGSQW